MQIWPRLDQMILLLDLTMDCPGICTSVSVSVAHRKSRQVEWNAIADDWTGGVTVRIPVGILCKRAVEWNIRAGHPD